MNDGEGIVFGEVSVREPARMRRPDRDARKACVAYGTPRADDLPIFLDRRPADAIERHALSDMSVELGGILLGKECVDDETGQPFVLVTEALEAKHYENTQASFTYTHDSWEEITRERDRTFPDLDIVGWYHTHPDFGIFLSSHDLFIHQNFFAQPLQVAYVVDPVRQQRGFFQWREGGLAPVRGFYLCGERTERLELSRLANDLENLPNPEGRGALSPRLEAELIAMLSRPRSSAPADRGLTGAVFGLGGAVIGVLMALLLFWIGGMAQEVRRQADALEALRLARNGGTGGEGQAAEAQAQRIAAKEAALDTILAEVKIGTPPESIRKSYEAALEEVNTLKARLELNNTEKEALARHADSMKRTALDASAELAAVRREADNRERDLESRLTDAQTELQRRRNEAAGGTAAERDNQYNLLLWAAVGGWLAFAATLAGLIALLVRRPRDDDALLDTRSVTVRVPQETTASERPPAQPPPHVIE